MQKKYIYRGRVRMNELYENIVLCQNGNKDAMEYVINKFEGLINSSKMSFPKNIYFNSQDIDDNKQDLIVSLLTIINRIPIENPGFKNEGCLVNYVYKSILNSKRNMFINKNIKRSFIENKYLSSVVELKDEYYIKDIESNIEIDDLLNCLTDKEKMIIKSEFINCKSDVEIGRILGVSRQAINKIKNRALKKLKDNI